MLLAIRYLTDNMQSRTHSLTLRNMHICMQEHACAHVSVPLLNVCKHMVPHSMHTLKHARGCASTHQNTLLHEIDSGISVQL